jgi:hypothetical protein
VTSRGDVLSLEVGVEIADEVAAPRCSGVGSRYTRGPWPTLASRLFTSEPALYPERGRLFEAGSGAMIRTCSSTASSRRQLQVQYPIAPPQSL